jgi:pimeloyl-ACP methyl ester carboxylesterase
MGAFLAVDFISQYPDKVDEVILVSVRKKYEKKNIERIKSYLKKSKNGYLYKFFKSCFCQKEQETLSWFKKNFLSGYLNQMSLPLLLEGLDYLLSAQIDPQKLNRLKIKFVHGSKDKIAPLREALQIKDNLSQAEFISLKNTGHLPFLNPNFKILCAIK